MLSPILIHLSTVLPAIIIGGVVLSMRKGTALHKRLGRIWVGLMLIAAISSFWIKNTGSFSWIHILSTWILICLAGAIYFIRRKNIKRHRNMMIGSFLGLIGAGIGALAPGRLLSTFLFGG